MTRTVSKSNLTGSKLIQIKVSELTDKFQGGDDFGAMEALHFRHTARRALGAPATCSSKKTPTLSLKQKKLFGPKATIVAFANLDKLNSVSCKHPNSCADLRGDFLREIDS